MRPIMEELSWITIPDLPDCDQLVLCATKDDLFCGWWDSEEGTWKDCTAAPVTGVLWWATVQGPKA